MTAARPPVCVHCGRVRDSHRAGTLQCPATTSHQRAMLTGWYATVFVPKVPRNRTGAILRTRDWV